MRYLTIALTLFMFAGCALSRATALEGKTWRNAAGNDAPRAVVDACFDEAKGVGWASYYAPDVLRACLYGRGYRPVK